MARFALVGLTGWAAIVALAWRLADSRIALCARIHDSLDPPAVACLIRSTATRDNVLVWGAIVALAGILVAAALYRSTAPRRSSPVQSRHDSKPLLRS